LLETSISLLKDSPLIDLVRQPFRAIRTHRLETLAVTAIFALAALLRLGWPGVNAFGFDEGTLSLIALNMARGGRFAAIGMPSSVGIPNPPAAAWIMAGPYLVTPDPLFATLFVGVLSLLAVVGVWAMARRAWGVPAGLAAALFLAASPQSVFYARNIWSQNLLPPLALLWAWAGYRAASRPARRWAITLNVFLAGTIFQVHLAGAALALGTLYLGIRYCWWRQLTSVLIGAALAILALAPYAVTVACCRPDVAAQFRTLSATPSQTDLSAFAQTIQLGIGTGWAYVATGRLDTLSQAIFPAAAMALLLPLGLMALGKELFPSNKLIVRPDSLAPMTSEGETVGHPNPPSSAMHLTPRPKPDASDLAALILVWLLATPLFFLRHTTPVLPHYELAALPALALAVGAATSLLRDRRGAWLIVGAMAIIAVTWAVQIGTSLNLERRVETPDGLGTPLSITRDAAYGLPTQAPVLFFTHGDNPATDGEAAIFSVLWWNRPHRIVNGEDVLILPPEPAYLMATLAPFQAWEELRDGGLISNLLTFPRRKGALPFVATPYDGHSDPTGFTPFSAPILLDDGLQLEGWRARRVGNRLRISTLWRVVSVPASGTYQQFHHLNTSTTLDGQPFLVSDVPLSAFNWRMGDRLIVMGDFFPKAANHFWVDVGQYTLPDLKRAARIDGTGDSIRLGPFDWSP